MNTCTQSDYDSYSALGNAITLDKQAHINTMHEAYDETTITRISCKIVAGYL